MIEPHKVAVHRMKSLHVSTIPNDNFEASVVSMRHPFIDRTSRAQNGSVVEFTMRLTNKTVESRYVKAVRS